MIFSIHYIDVQKLLLKFTIYILVYIYLKMLQLVKKSLKLEYS